MLSQRLRAKKKATFQTANNSKEKLQILAFNTSENSWKRIFTEKPEKQLFGVNNSVGA